MRRETEKRWLQLAMAVACLVPIGGGAMGMINGVDLPGALDLDSHMRYLSGLLLGIGLCFARLIPTIERQTGMMRLLTTMVLIGGCGRLYGLVLNGAPNPLMTAALVMELGVTPVLCLWQQRVAKRFCV